MQVDDVLVAAASRRPSSAIATRLRPRDAGV
jgi:hypothetical protein